jgi:hypothetical protein
LIKSEEDFEGEVKKLGKIRHHKSDLESAQKVFDEMSKRNVEINSET